MGRHERGRTRRAWLALVAELALSTGALVVGLASAGNRATAIATAATPGAAVGTATVAPAGTAGSTTTVTYTATGQEQRFVVPPGVTRVRVVAVGGPGGDSEGAGGRGAVVTATLAATAGATLYVEVGGAGQVSGRGSFNSGGAGTEDAAEGSGGGDGASDIRISGRARGRRPAPRWPRASSSRRAGAGAPAPPRTPGEASATGGTRVRPAGTVPATRAPVVVTRAARAGTGPIAGIATPRPTSERTAPMGAWALGARAAVQTAAAAAGGCTAVGGAGARAAKSPAGAAAAGRASSPAAPRGCLWASPRAAPTPRSPSATSGPAGSASRILAHVL